MVKSKNNETVREFHEALSRGDSVSAMDLLADDVIWYVPGRNLLSGEYRGKAQVTGFFARVRELSHGTIKTELVDVLYGDSYGIALVRVFGERLGKKIEGQLQAFTCRVENGRIAEFWFLVEDRYAVDDFWT